MDTFSERAATWDDDPDKSERAREVADAIRAQLPLDGSERVLEFGGGTGLLSRQFAGDVAEILITDAAPGMVAVARQRIDELGPGSRMRAEQFDPTSADPDPGSFDLVWSLLALHHVPDAAAALRRLRELLVPGGRLAIADLDEDPEGAFHAAHGDFHGHDGFSREGLRDTLTEVGFTDIAFTTATRLTKEVGGQPRDFPLFLVTARRDDAERR